MGRGEPPTVWLFGRVEEREVAGGVSEADVELNKGELMCLGDAGIGQHSHCESRQDTDQSEAP